MDIGKRQKNKKADETEIKPLYATSEEKSERLDESRDEIAKEMLK